MLWHWWVICHAAAVILSVYDRCQIKFIFLLKASSQLLNRPLLSAAPRCSLVLGAMSSLITLSNKPKEVEGGWRIILVYSQLMATWQTASCFFQFCKQLSRIIFRLLVLLRTHTVSTCYTTLKNDVHIQHICVSSYVLKERLHWPDNADNVLNPHKTDISN